MLVWKQCTRDITDRLIWRLKDSIIHLDEKGILLSETEKNLLLSFSWQKSETRGETLHGKWECHYSCWHRPCQGHLISPTSNFLFPEGSMGTWALWFNPLNIQYRHNTTSSVSSQYKVQWCDGHQWNGQNRISASLGSWDCEHSTIPAGL